MARKQIKSEWDYYQDYLKEYANLYKGKYGKLAPFKRAYTFEEYQMVLDRKYDVLRSEGKDVKKYSKYTVSRLLAKEQRTISTRFLQKALQVVRVGLGEKKLTENVYETLRSILSGRGTISTLFINGQQFDAKSSKQQIFFEVMRAVAEEKDIEIPEARDLVEDMYGY